MQIPMPRMRYADRYPLEARVAAVRRAETRRPDRVAAVIESDGQLPAMPNDKFLLPMDLTGAQLSYIIRRRLTLQKESALFLLCDGRLVAASTTMRELRARHASADGFVYIEYTAENSFG